VGSQPLAGLVVLDREAIRAGALADLAVLAPAVAVYAALRGLGLLSGDGGATVTAVIGAVGAPLTGGAVAGGRATPTPLTHGALAAGVASVGFVVFRLGDAVVRDQPVHAASIVILMILSMTLGLLGGVVGSRRRRPPLADSGP
jgi:hypothetical protein